MFDPFSRPSASVAAACGLALAFGTQSLAQFSPPDISNNVDEPDRFVLSEGSNTVSGSVSNAAQPGGDPDFFTLVVPDGWRIDRIELTNYTGAAVSFFGFAEGDSLPAVPTQDGATFTAEADGFALIGADQIGGQLFFPLVIGDVNIPGEPPTPPLISTPRFDPIAGLGPGSYAFVFEETSAIAVNYELDFQVSQAIPEPSSALLTVGTTALLSLRRRRRANA